MTIDRDAYRGFFQRLTGRTPYEYQVRVAAELAAGRNVVLRAPTGAGKTWSVLVPFLFAGWERRPGRLIYALPLRTLAQGVYREAQNAHSAAARLRHGLSPSFHDGNGRDTESIVTLQTGEQPDDRFFDRGRIIVTTYDQVLSGLLCGPYGLSDRLHNINAASVVGTLVVFDEFHLMAPELAFLTAAASLNLFRDLCQSVWMTATATPPLEAMLADAVKAVSVPGSPAEAEALLQTVPSVTTVHREIVMESTPLTAAAVVEARRLRASRGDPNSSGMSADTRSIVLMNTVGRAQMIFEELRSLWTPSDPVPVLLHSRFFAEHRRAKEREIRTMLGRDARGPAILVATQVVEAGLDISCDDLHTELCPMNALVQRAGRCARFEGEEGTVHVHPLPGVERAWLPYGNPAREHPAMTHTRELLSRVKRASLHPREAATWVEAVHWEDDETALREGWRVRRRRCTDRILHNAIERDVVRVADLIRGEDGDSIYVLVTADEAPRRPAEREGLSLSRRSIARLVRETSAGGPVGWWWDLSGEDGAWRPLESQSDVQRTYVVCLRAAFAAYDQDVGLRLGLAGHEESPPRSEPARPGWAPLRAEGWADHAQAVARESLRRLAREAWTTSSEVLPGSWEVAAAAGGFRRRYGLAPGVVAEAVRFCAVLHDLGKLGDGWQRWAEAAQRAKDPGYVHAMALAHTDFDPEKPEDHARERALGVRRPPHAPCSAYYARLFLGPALGLVPLERRGQVASACLAAILSHHGGWWPREFEHSVPDLWSGWESAIRDVPGFLPPPTDRRSVRTHPMEPLLNLSIGPDSVEDAWPLVAFLMRTLRLSDQRATAEAGCHE
jgi:CRISPR-associated endonuclease/helicase Cas3